MTIVETRVTPTAQTTIFINALQVSFDRMDPDKSHKIEIIKTVRNAYGLGLLEAKTIVEMVLDPGVKQGENALAAVATLV